MGIALLVGLANGALHEAQNAQLDGQDRLGYSALLNGLAAISPTYPTALRVAEDVAKYHFAGFDCICLRCGALFNEDAEEATEQAPRQP
jgi:hypothetical protein